MGRTNTNTNTNTETHKIYTLKNGLTIWFQPMQNTQLFNIGVYILSGNNTEKRKDIELSHLIEHCFSNFTSTKWSSAYQNEKWFKENGIVSDGEVTEYMTKMWLHGTSKEHEKITDIFVNALLDFKLDPNIVEQERAALIAELSEWQNDPVTLTEEEKIKKFFYPKHPALDVTLRDRINNAKNASATRIKNYFYSIFEPTNSVVYVVGNFGKNTNAMRRKLKTLSSVRGQKKDYINFKKLSHYKRNMALYKKPHFLKDPYDKIVHFFLYIHPPITMFDKSLPIFTALNSILQEQLYWKLRFEEGLIYHVNVDTYFDPINPTLSYSKFNFYTVNRKDGKKALTFTNHIIKNFVTSLNNDMLKLHKSMSDRRWDEFSSHDCGLERDLERSIRYFLFDKKYVKPKNKYKAEQKVTVDDLRVVAKQCYRPEDIYIFYTGQKKITLKK